MNSNLKNFIKYHYIATPLELRKQEYWSGLSFPTPGDLPDSGVEHLSLAAPALAGRFFTAVPPGKPKFLITVFIHSSNTYLSAYHVQISVPLCGEKENKERRRKQDGLPWWRSG